jgi:hypothetical protein
MKAAGNYHHIECPFSLPSYFTGVAVILGDTITLIDAGAARARKQSIELVLEELFEDRKMRRLGDGNELLWLSR